MDVVCKWCQREVRKSNLLKHYGTHATEWSQTVKSDIKQYCWTNRKPLMYEFGKKVNTIPWVLCLACCKSKTINVRKFIVEHNCECVWDRYKHLYEPKNEVIPALVDDNHTALIIEIQELKEKLRISEQKEKQLRAVLARMDDERFQAQKAQKMNEIIMEPVGNTEPYWDWDKPRSELKNIDIDRIHSVLQHIVEERMYYKYARAEFQELVDELESHDLGRPYELLRDYIQEECTLDDLVAYFDKK